MGGSMFTLEIRLTTGELKIENVQYCGLNPDYLPHASIYFVRTVDGSQYDIPMSSLVYVKRTGGSSDV